MPLSRRTVILGTAGLALAGCGGGGDSSLDPNVVSKARPRLSILWAAQGGALLLASQPLLFDAMPGR
jgi:hypothetical protein